MEYEEKRKIADALAYTVTQVVSEVERPLVVHEFWLSMNRKGLVKNEEVSMLVIDTLRKLQTASSFPVLKTIAKLCLSSAK